MDADRFDRWTQGLDTRLSRRGLSAIAAGALATLGLGSVADAKKKKKKKKKKKNVAVPPPPTPLPAPPPGANISCQNLGTACGNTAICQCLLDTSARQVCENVTIPPNGITFVPCQANVNCGAGQVCDAFFNVCVLTCAN